MTDNRPKISYSVSSSDHVIDKGSDLWNHPLPSDRFAGSDENGESITIGDYFDAATGFLSSNGYDPIIHASSILTGKTIHSGDISEIAICLVKHGAFYHPSMITVNLRESDVFLLALNLATSPEGIRIIDRECSALSKISKITDRIPRLFGKGSSCLKNGKTVSMFLVEWFDGYFEFHVSQKDDTFQTIVWDTTSGSYFLDEKESYEIYRQSAAILSDCYNVDTGEQIQPWHHAAGDFVVKRTDNAIDVRLITIRQYTSLFQDPLDDSDNGYQVLEAAMIFLAGLSIRMRLDRIDGIHEIHWLPDYVVGAVVDGFMGCLDNKTSHLINSLPVKQAFMEFCRDLEYPDILDYAEMLIKSYHPASPDLPIILSNLDRHTGALFRCLKEYTDGKHEDKTNENRMNST